jgi:hypothetical protein
MVAPVEIGKGGVKLLIDNGLLKQHQVNDRYAVGEACLAALEQWAGGRGARSMVHGSGLGPWIRTGSNLRRHKHKAGHAQSLISLCA